MCFVKNDFRNEGDKVFQIENRQDLEIELQEEKQITIEKQQRVLTVLGIIICIILIPLLLINIILIIEGFTNPDEVPALAGYSPMMVLTDSMSPKIKSGDLIVIKEIDPTTLKVDDIITFFDPAGNGQTTVTHRILKIENIGGKLMFETQGDNNNTPDRLLVEAEAVIGIYLFRIPIVANIIMFMQTVPGLILCIFVPLIALAAYDLFRRKKYDKKQEEEKQALLNELGRLRLEKEKQNKDIKK